MYTWKRVRKIEALVVKEGEHYYVAAPKGVGRLLPFETVIVKVKPNFYDYLRENLLDDLVQDFLEYKFEKANKVGRT